MRRVDACVREGAAALAGDDTTPAPDKEALRSLWWWAASGMKERRAVATWVSQQTGISVAPDLCFVRLTEAFGATGLVGPRLSHRLMPPQSIAVVFHSRDRGSERAFIRLNRDLWDRLAEKARQQGMTRRQIITAAVRAYIGGPT